VWLSAEKKYKTRRAKIEPLLRTEKKNRIRCERRNVELFEKRPNAEDELLSSCIRRENDSVRALIELRSLTGFSIINDNNYYDFCVLRFLKK